jgi:hypothetical protein
MNNIEELRKKLRLAEIEESKKRVNEWYTSIESKASSLVGKAFVKQCSNKRVLLFKVLGFNRTGYIDGLEKWLELKVSHIILLDKPQPEGFGKTHKMTYRRALVAKFKTGYTHIGQIISNYAQSSEYGSAPDEIIRLGKGNFPSKIDAKRSACAAFTNWMLYTKEVPNEVYDNALNVVLKNQEQTLKFVDKFNKYL